MKIGIIGYGVVGAATAKSYVEHVEEVRVYDEVKEKCTHLLSQVLESDLIFLCLPSPQSKNGLGCDTSIIEDFCRRWQGSPSNFVLKSTVPVGTTKRLSQQYWLPNLVHSPEFLTARCAFTDAQMPTRNIIGVPFPYEDCSSLFRGNYHGVELVSILYHQRFPHVDVQLMSSDESELVKLGLNGFFSVKIAYFNELNKLCITMGLDWQKVITGILTDGRISHNHTTVPGHNGFGFGGECLPKDLDNLIHCIKNNVGTDEAKVTKAAYDRNEQDRKREK